LLYLDIRSGFFTGNGYIMPIVSELQRDRVALLLTLNVLLFVGYAVTVVMQVAIPSVWLVAFLIIGLAYNVIELWQSSPYKQSPDAVGMRARSMTKPAAVVGVPKLGRALRTDPVLGTQGITIGRESLSQRLAELQASMPLQNVPVNEVAAQSVEASSAMQTTEADAAVLSELPAEMLETTVTESIERFQEINVIANVIANVINVAPAAPEPMAMILTGGVAANDAQVSDNPDTGSPVRNTMDEAAPEAEVQAPSIGALSIGSEIVSTTAESTMVDDVSLPDLFGVEVASAVPEAPEQNVEQIFTPAVEPGLDSVAEAVPVAEPLSAQVDDVTTASLPVIAAASENRIEGAVEPSVEVVAEQAVASVAIPVVTHLAGRRQDVVDIVIASMVSDAKRPQPAKPTVADEQPALAAKVRTPSESLAMLRSELAKTRGHAGAAAQARAPAAPRKPLGAARKPGKSPADGTRDRVMFVWHGRHFLAPIEGRHPLRVAQSLYDFMVEEAMEHG